MFNKKSKKDIDEVWKTIDFWNDKVKIKQFSKGIPYYVSFNVRALYEIYLFDDPAFRHSALDRNFIDNLKWHIKRYKRNDKLTDTIFPIDKNESGEYIYWELWDKEMYIAIIEKWKKDPYICDKLLKKWTK